MAGLNELPAVVSWIPTPTLPPSQSQTANYINQVHNRTGSNKKTIFDKQNYKLYKFQLYCKTNLQENILHTHTNNNEVSAPHILSWLNTQIFWTDHI